MPELTHFEKSAGLFFITSAAGQFAGLAAREIWTAGMVVIHTMHIQIQYVAYLKTRITTDIRRQYSSNRVKHAKLKMFFYTN